MAGVLDAQRRLIEQRQQRVELRVHGRRGAQAGHRARDQRMGVGPFGLVQAIQGRTRGEQQPSAVCETRMLRMQLLDLAFPKLQRLDLALLVAQQLEPRAALVGGALELDAAVQQREPRRCARCAPGRSTPRGVRSCRAARAASPGAPATGIRAGRGYRTAARPQPAAPAAARTGRRARRGCGHRCRSRAAAAARPRARDRCSSSRCSSSPAVAVMSAVAVISARSAPLRTHSAPARPPASSSRASTIMDLPAPVSPVSTVRPGWNSSSTASISAKSRICR